MKIVSWLSGRLVGLCGQSSVWAEWPVSHKLLPLGSQSPEKALSSDSEGLPPPAHTKNFCSAKITDAFVVAQCMKHQHDQLHLHPAQTKLTFLLHLPCFYFYLNSDEKQPVLWKILFFLTVVSLLSGSKGDFLCNPNRSR